MRLIRQAREQRMSTSDKTSELQKHPALPELKRKLRRPQADDLLWRHKVGALVERLCPKADRAYGAFTALEMILEELEAPDTSQASLRKMRNFSLRYTEDEVEALRKSDGVGFQLNWSQVAILVDVKNAKNRSKLQAGCSTKGWSSNTLCQKARQVQKRTSRGGRPYAESTNCEDALRQLIDETSTWLRRYRLAWFEGKKDKKGRVVQEPAFREETAVRTGQAKELFQDAIKLLADVERAAKSGREKLFQFSDADRRSNAAKRTSKRKRRAGEVRREN